MNRRQLLQWITASTLAPALSATHWQVMAATPDSAAPPAKLLLVFLRGGYDAANLLVPYSSPFYYESRPTIAIAKPGDSPQSALMLDANWGLHPALRESIYPMFQNRQAAFIPFAGTDDLSRSHFETQDNIESGFANTGPRNYQSGFLGRLAAVLTGTPAIAMTNQPPLIMRGSVQYQTLH